MNYHDVFKDLVWERMIHGYWHGFPSVYGKYSEHVLFMHAELELSRIYSNLATLGSVKWPTNIGISRDYVGGLMDGEGHVGINHHIRKEKKRHQYLTRVQIAIREREVIEPLVWFGGKIKSVDNSRWNKNAKGIHLWTIHNREAEKFILAVLPSMRNPTKILAAKIALQMEFLRNHSGKRGHVEDATRIAKQEFLYRAILNNNSRKTNFTSVECETDVVSLTALEALEALRHKNPPDHHCPEFDNATVELADGIIRILDFAGARNLPIGEALVAKHSYNINRPRKHGKEF